MFSWLFLGWFLWLFLLNKSGRILETVATHGCNSGRARCYLLSFCARLTPRSNEWTLGPGTFGRTGWSRVSRRTAITLETDGQIAPWLKPSTFSPLTPGMPRGPTNCPIWPLNSCIGPGSPGGPNIPVSPWKYAPTGARLLSRYDSHVELTVPNLDLTHINLM